MLLYLDYLKGILPCRNPEETVAYYEKILLFPKEGKRSFALGRSGHMEVVESSPVYAVGPSAFWVEANHVDHVYETVHTQSGLHLLVDLKNTYYGSREFQVTDPAGNITCIINYRKDLTDAARRASAELYAKEEFRVVLYVKNLSACYRFYTELLGLKDVYRWEENRGDRGFKYEITPGSKCYIETLFREPMSVQKQGTIVLKNTDPESEYGRIASLAPDAVVFAFDGFHFTLQDPDGNYVIIEKG